MGRIPLLLLAAFIAWSAGVAPASAAKKVALVIGNDSYDKVAPLHKAVNDAKGMGDTLEELGFEVIRGENATRRELNRRLLEFRARLETGDVGFFFFAGHGIEIAGRNYLLPTDIPDAAPGQEEFVEAEAIAVDTVLDTMRRQGTRISVVVLDACRDNPFKREGTRSVGGSRGLVRMAAPEGTFIIYSAGVGQTALDRLGNDDPNPNSLFTRSLIPLLKQPGLSLTQTARRVRRAVQTLASSVAHSQRPAYYDEVTGDFFFAGPGRKMAPTSADRRPPLSPLSPVAQAWGVTKDTTSIAVLEAFIARFPDTVFAELARARLGELQGALTARPGEPKVAVGITPEQPAIDAEEAKAKCDALAADKSDPAARSAGIGEGVPDWAVRAKASDAVEACQAAVRAAPSEPRYRYQLARGLYHAVRFKDAVDAAEKAAEAGHGAAMGLVAGWYGAPNAGLHRDSEKSFARLLKAAESGDPGAMDSVASAYRRGDGVVKDRRLAQDWFRRAHDAYQRLAEAGDTDAMTSLAYFYVEGKGRAKDPDAGFRWYLRAAEAGDPSAIGSVSYAYEYGEYGQSKNESLAKQWDRRRFQTLMERAHRGDADAMNDLAWRYSLGEGIEQNEPEALRWFRKSGDAGYYHALDNLAFHYRNGYGTPKNESEAFRLYQRYNSWDLKAAEAGDAGALHSIGSAYSSGKGVAKSAQQALRYFKMAYDYGYTGAAASIGDLYADGDDYVDITTDKSEAFTWYRRAAEASNWSAYVTKKVAAYYDKGEAVARDSRLAAELLLRYFDRYGKIDTYDFDALTEDYSADMRREMQSMLKNAGHYPGAIDGQFGAGTRRAIDDYVSRIE